MTAKDVPLAVRPVVAIVATRVATMVRHPQVVRVTAVVHQLVVQERSQIIMCPVARRAITPRVHRDAITMAAVAPPLVGHQGRVAPVRRTFTAAIPLLWGRATGRIARAGACGTLAGVRAAARRVQRPAPVATVFAAALKLRLTARLTVAPPPQKRVVMVFADRAKQTPLVRLIAK